MSTKVQAYLSFEGRCEEALEFYKSSLDAVVENVMRFKEMSGPVQCGPGESPPVIPNGEKILHSSFTIGETQLMASDGRMSGEKAEFKGISLALTVPDDATAKKRFDALAASGMAIQEPTPAFFTTSFSIVADKFGVTWMIVSNTQPKAP
jgi:PhnB protein